MQIMKIKMRKLIEFKIKITLNLLFLNNALDKLFNLKSQKSEILKIFVSNNLLYF